MKRRIFPAMVILASLTGGRICDAEPIELTLDTGSPAHVVAPGQEDRVALIVANPAAEPAGVKVHVEVESFDGSTATAEDDLTVSAKGRQRWPLPKSLFGELGIKWVKFRAGRDGGESPPQQAAYAYMKPAGPTSGRCDGFHFGIAYGAGPDNHAPRAAERAALCGVKIARGHPVWPQIQPRPGQWDWSSCDAIVDAHARQGIEVQLLLSGAPRWSWQDEGEGVPTVAAWKEFCRELARRYRGRVRYYELWNEPDIDFFRGTQEQYIELLEAGYAAIKSADADARVTTGGFVSMTHHGRKPMMIERVIRDCQDHYDRIAYHTHGEFAHFREELDQRLLPYCRQVLTGPRPLYFTETGMDTRFGEHFQARTLAKKIAFAWSRGAVAYTWFNLHDMRAAEHPRQPGFTYGLYTRLDRLDPSQPYSPENMDYDRAWPKAAYVSYNTLTSLLANKRFLEQYALGHDQYAFLFSGGGEHVVLSWVETPSAAAPHLVLATDAEGADRVDLMGNRRPWPVAAGRTVLPLAEEPAYLVLRGGPPPRLEGHLIAPATAGMAVPGRPLTVEVEVWNPTQQSAVFEAEWEMPEGLHARGPNARWPLAAGERRKMAFDVTAPCDTVARFGDVFPCKMTYRLAPIGWSSTVVVPVVMGAVRVPSSDLPKQASFRLSESRQVVNLSEHDPHTAHLLWKGRQDLSADVRLAWVDEGLKVQVDVQDDVYHAPAGENAAEGDRVELLLHVPGQEGVWRVALGEMGGKACARIAAAPKGRGEPTAGLAVGLWGDPPEKHYAVTLPRRVFGFSDQGTGQGVRLNLRVYDDDGRGQKGWLQIAPGDEQMHADSWPLILF